MRENVFPVRWTKTIFSEVYNTIIITNVKMNTPGLTAVKTTLKFGVQRVVVFPKRASILFNLKNSKINDKVDQ